VPTICFRCSEAEKAELEVRANGEISAYIRARLFNEDDVKPLLEQLLLRFDPTESGGPGYGSMEGLLAEVLLLLRMTMKPDVQREARAEVERLGLPVWATE